MCAASLLQLLSFSHVTGLLAGTADVTKVHVGIVNGFALLKGDPTNKVDFVLMAEGGYVVDDKAMRAVSAFGLPPVANLLDAPEMQDEARVTWTV